MRGNNCSIPSVEEGDGEPPNEGEEVALQTTYTHWRASGPRPPPPQRLSVACTPGPPAVSWLSPPEQHMILYDYCYCLCPSSRRLQAGCAGAFGGEEDPARKSRSRADKRGTRVLQSMQSHKFGFLACA